MSDDLQNLNDEEKLKAENEFLKLKLMLEQGAQFGKMETDKMLSFTQCTAFNLVTK